jgi:hypothetical protein
MSRARTDLHAVARQAKSEPHVAGHFTHFLRRLDRLADGHIELAMTLYKDADLLREVLAGASLPEGASRVAISLDDPREGPFVVVTRDGAYVTCLARGMALRDCPVVTRERIDVAASRVERMRERLAALKALERDHDGETARLFHRMQQAGPLFAREDFEALARWEPLLGGEFVKLAASLQCGLFRTFWLLGQRRPDRIGGAEHFLETWWRAFWAWNHALVLMNLGDTARAIDEHPDRSPEEDSDFRVMTSSFASRFGMVSLTARSLWGVGRHGRALLRPTKRSTFEGDPLRRACRSLTLATIAHASRRSRDEATRAIVHAAESGHPLDVVYRHAVDAPLVAGIESGREEATRLYDRCARQLAADLFEGRDDLPVRVARPDDVPIDVARALVTVVNDSWVMDPAQIISLVAAVPWLARARPAELFLPRAWTTALGRPYDLETGLALLRHLQVTFDFGKPEAVKVERRPRRNDRCPCGTGKKYKRCCGASSAPPVRLAS